MAPISKTNGTWIRRPSQTGSPNSSSDEVNHLNSNSNNMNSGVLTQTRLRKKSKASSSQRSSSVPSFMAASDGGRSYVDPWDMENYSFLRRQLEDVSLASDHYNDNDNVSSTPAFESTQSDFYYVPLDNDGCPQYQYKQYFDQNGTSQYLGEDLMASLPYKEDTYGRVAGVDERDFCNDYLDPRMMHSREVSGSFMDYNNIINNPSRQSERSRYNNQDYQNYTPPSLDVDRYKDYYTLYRKGRKSYSDLNLNEHQPRDRSISRRKSFQNLDNGNFMDIPHQKRKQHKVMRRQSVHEIARETISRDYPSSRDNKARRRESFHETADDKESIYRSTLKSSSKEQLNCRTLRRTSIHDVDYSGTRKVSRSNSFFDDGYADSSLVYVYETARRRRAMVLPNPEAYRKPRYINNESENEEYGKVSMALKPELYASRPLGRYAMTNYGHLKIDYSCSWNNLDRYISDKTRA